MKCKANRILGETIREKRLKEAEKLRQEYGDEWEQSEELEDMILASDELPSNKWYRKKPRRWE